MSVYKDNALNKYESYTYNWAVHMCNPRAIGERPGNLIRNNRVVTLAESGIENEISIDGVEQSFVLTFNNPDRRAIANTFKFDFTEVAGITFYSRILKAAQDLGIPNHIKATYILELNMTGQLDGQPVRRPQELGPFYYICTLTALGMSYQNGAAFYAANFIETKDQAFDSLDFALISKIEFSASTYSEFLTKFQDELNKQSVNFTAISQSRLYPNEYVLEDGYGASSWLFGPVDPGELPVNRLVSVSGAGSNLTFSLEKGTTITSAMTMALMHTTNFRRIPVGGGRFLKDNPEDRVANAPRYADLVRWVTYDTNVEYGIYDPLANNYVKKITYRSVPNFAPQAINDPESYSEFSSSATNQQSKINRMFRNGQLVKRYDHVFTGKNTEILNLDLTLNNTYYVMQTVDAPRYPQDHFANAAERTASALKGTLDQLKAKRNELNRNIEAIARTADESVGRAPRLIAPLRAELAGIEEQIRNTEAALSDATRRLGGDAFLNTNPYRFTATKKYITQSELYSSSEFNPNNRELLTPVTFRYDETANPGDAGPERGQQSVGAAGIVAMYQNLYSTYDLMQIGLNIRGDTFWLGQAGGVDYQLGGNAFFLNVRIPRYPNDITGLMDKETTYMLSGVYVVLTGKASYRSGQFTMTLYAYKDMQAQTPLIYHMLDRGEITNTDEVSNDPGVASSTDESSPGSETTRPGAPDNPIAPGQTGDSPPGGHELSTTNVNPILNSILAQTGNETGVRVVTTSGFRAGSDSGRHLGDGSDVILYSGSRRLSVSNAADRAIIATFTQNFINNARDLGQLPSVGAANHTAPQSQWYMGGNTFHFDIARGSSISSDRGSYWGNGQTSAGAPSWLSGLFS